MRMRLNHLVLLSLGNAAMLGCAASGSNAGAEDALVSNEDAGGASVETTLGVGSYEGASRRHHDAGTPATDAGTDASKGSGSSSGGTSSSSGSSSGGTSSSSGGTSSSSGSSSGGTSSSSGGTSSSSGSSSGGTSSSSGAGACGANGSGIFSAPTAWTTDVSGAPHAPASAAMNSALTAAGGWGPGKTSFQIDMGLVVLHATSATPMVPFTQADGYESPDCDSPSTVPLVAGGVIEGMTNYTCDPTQSDCHLLVVYPPTNTLYEFYQATSLGGGITAGCAVLWDLTKTYPADERGDQCTSADAAGFPMSAMLPDADEVASGEITHALRVALPNSRMAKGVYVHPATQAGGPSGSAALPPT